MSLTKTTAAFHEEKEMRGHSFCASVLAQVHTMRKGEDGRSRAESSEAGQKKAVAWQETGEGCEGGYSLYGLPHTGTPEPPEC